MCVEVFAVFVFVANFGAASLEVRAVGARGEFAEFFLGGDPDFDVVFFGGGSAEVAVANVEDLVVKAEVLHDFFFGLAD